MKKMATVFVIDHETGTVIPQVREGLEWVIRGEGTATVKFDGSACRWHDDRLWKRYDRKLNKQAQRRLDRGLDVFGQGSVESSVLEPDATGQLPKSGLHRLHEELFKTPPEGFEPCESAPDPVTFHWPG